jgi:hypothetical protein
MRNKPFIFNLFCLTFLLIAISFPMQIMMIYGHDPLEIQAIMSKLTIINHICIGFLFFNSWLTWKCAPLLKWTLPMMIGLVAFNNWVVSRYGADFDFTSTTLATALFTVFTSSILFTKGMDVLDSPDKRWWLIPKRYQKKLPIYLKTAKESFVLAKTFDISSTGVFVSLDQAKDHFHRRNQIDFFPGELVKLQIPTNDQSDFTCQARIVRKTHGGGIYPGGLGIQFENMNLMNRLRLYRIMRTSEFNWN